MGSKKKSGGSHGRDNHHDRDDHHHHGGHKGVNLKGTKSDDVLTGTARNDRISGGKGDDELFGLAGNDLLLGGKGDDSLLGGAGNDVLYGDGPGQDKFWFWGKCLWWIPQSDDDDFLDGGAGNDTVFAGRGDDVLLYSMAGNLGTGFANIGTHDIYDGGSGFDTLLLELTYGEYLLGSVQADIDAFKAFLEDKANPRSDHGKVFQFKSFDLDARNFEALEVRLVNNVPTANDDANATDEDSSLVIPAAELLANDTDPDHLDVLVVKYADALSLRGAQVALAADGTVTYDPTHALELQELAEGKTATDSFSYTIADLAGATSTTTVEIKVTGVNDAPVAVDDEVTLPVISDGSGPVEETTLNFTGAPNSTPFTVDDYVLNGFFGADHPFSGEPVAAVDTGSSLNGYPVGIVGAVRLGEDDIFSAVSVDIALIGGAHPVKIYGYLGGEQVDGLIASQELTTAFATVTFGPAWTGIDELRFEIVGLAEDFLLIDNLRLASGDGGGAGVVVEPIDIDVLANDTDVDIGDVLALITWDDTSTMGAAISRKEDGTLHYDPTEIDLPALAPGEFLTDTFEYMVSDSEGATSVATVSVVLQGADEPVVSIASFLSAPDVDLV